MTEESTEAFVQELESFLSQAKHPSTRQLLQDAINRSRVSTPKTVKLQQPTPSGPPTKPIIQVKTYGWDQGAQNVKIYISDIPELATIKETQLWSEFTENSVQLKINDLNNRHYSFSINELSGKIEPDSSKAILKRGSVIITMPKASIGNWEVLTMAEQKSKDAKKEKEKLSDPAKSKEDPSASIMNMMQKMYDDGDDEMKRTISKAWYESKSGKAPKMDTPEL